MKEITTQIEINASPAEVWLELTNFSAYGEWNPFVKQISGSLEKDAILQVKVAPPGKKEMAFTPKLIEVTPSEELCWEGKLGVKGLFDGRHRFLLSELPNGRTLLIHSEQFRGVLVPFIFPFLREATTKGFQQMNEALASRASNKNSN